MITPDVTPPLDEFLKTYEQDDNVWWIMDCGHHQNLFDQAVERMEQAERRLATRGASPTQSRPRSN